MYTYFIKLVHAASEQLHEKTSQLKQKLQLKKQTKNKAVRLFK